MGDSSLPHQLPTFTISFKIWDDARQGGLSPIAGSQSGLLPIGGKMQIVLQQDNIFLLDSGFCVLLESIWQPQQVCLQKEQNW